MKKIVIFGSSGMLGSETASHFSSLKGFRVRATERSLGQRLGGIEYIRFDAGRHEPQELEGILHDADYAINCIGIIKPYIHDNNPEEAMRAVEINSLFPYKLAKAAEKYNVRIIQIATDCIYNGKKGNYDEAAPADATDVYGISKRLGEVKSPFFMNLRCSIIGKEKKSRLSLLEWFLGQPQNSQVNGFINHMWNGITTKAFAKICEGIITENFFSMGTFHVIPADTMTKAEMLKCFAKIFGRNDIKINYVNAPEAVNRTIATNNPDFNRKLWQAAGYKKIPTITELTEEV